MPNEPVPLTTGWRPIESAPQIEYRSIRLRHDPTNYETVGYWRNADSFAPEDLSGDEVWWMSGWVDDVENDGGPDGMQPQPTHWMPHDE